MGHAQAVGGSAANVDLDFRILLGDEDNAVLHLRGFENGQLVHLKVGRDGVVAF